MKRTRKGVGYKAYGEGIPRSTKYMWTKKNESNVSNTSEENKESEEEKSEESEDLENIEFDNLMEEDSISSENFLQSLLAANYLQKENENISSENNREEQGTIFPSLLQYITQQKPIQSGPKLSNNLSEPIYENSKLNFAEAQILLSRFVIEHKLNNVAKDHLLQLLNCFMPKGTL